MHANPQKKFMEKYLLSIYLSIPSKEITFEQSLCHLLLLFIAWYHIAYTLYLYDYNQELELQEA